MKMHRGRVWQNRFWDHIIREQNDFNRHIDYIHYNPVKHGYVSNPADLKLSSFSKLKRKGVYPDDWGVVEPKNLDGDYGE